MILLLLSGCVMFEDLFESEAERTAKWDARRAAARAAELAEPCADTARDLAYHSSGTCRPDQRGRVEWPTSVPSKGDVAPMLVCTCIAPAADGGPPTSTAP